MNQELEETSLLKHKNFEKSYAELNLKSSDFIDRNSVE